MHQKTWPSSVGLTVASLLLLSTACTDKGATASDTAGGDDTAEASGPVDSDGDGISVEADCDDDDPLVGAATVWYFDGDLDGFGDAESEVMSSCEPVVGYVANSDDCDDGNFDIHPDAEEVCDDVDNDCEGTIDEGATDALTVCADADLDGFGSMEECLSVCDIPDGWIEDSSDCDDSNSQVFPEAPELCNGLDDDCDDIIDGDIDVWDAWLDEDGDGYGDPDAPVCDETVLDTVDNADDCDDSDEEIHPDGVETCNGQDDDCDGLPDAGVCTCPIEVYDGRPYQMCDEGEKWSDARDICEGDGYHLVTVNDAKENQWVSDTAALYRNRDTWWIGYSDLDLEGTWVWSDGSTSTYDNWNRGEPNGGTGESCAHFYTNHHIGHGVWNDENCDSNKHFVCEFGG